MRLRFAALRAQLDALDRGDALTVNHRELVDKVAALTGATASRLATCGRPHAHASGRPTAAGLWQSADRWQVGADTAYALFGDDGRPTYIEFPATDVIQGT